MSACEGNLALKAGEVCGTHLRFGSQFSINLAGHQNTVLFGHINSNGLIINQKHFVLCCQV